MVIAIVGAGLAGLTAGRLLAKAGHEVTIFEKSTGFGGRMATRYAGEEMLSRIDHGLPYFSAEGDEFREFIRELEEKNLVLRWGDQLSFFDGEKLIPTNPNSSGTGFYAASQGMNNIGKYLSRWVDVKLGQKVGGLTFFGRNRTRKRAWVVNFSSSDTFTADAVILALPAPQTYGILATTIDEINTLKIVREIDEVNYRPSYSLMAGFNESEPPSWEGVICKNSVLEFISNENSKRPQQSGTSLVLHATEEFSRQESESDSETVTNRMLAGLAALTGGWTSAPDWTQLHFWRYSRSLNKLPYDYMEHEDSEAPLAVIGDYFNGNSVEAAFNSGQRLARYWIEKYR